MMTTLCVQEKDKERESEKNELLLFSTSLKNPCGRMIAISKRIFFFCATLKCVGHMVK